MPVTVVAGSAVRVTLTWTNVPASLVRLWPRAQTLRHPSRAHARRDTQAMGSLRRAAKTSTNARRDHATWTQIAATTMDHTLATANLDTQEMARTACPSISARQTIHATRTLCVLPLSR
jgi:hypothetical protein